ncbi:MAG: thioredoxin domain-containing protein [Campylobacterota bacterium]
MKYLLCLLLFTTLIAEVKQAPNDLINESSPYLQQHAYNPVKWYPWGTKAFEKAKKEHKPIFLSIGYSTCHWCHVMARESFESDEVAALLNRDYIAIKVDREELPHLDSYYQQLHLKLNNRAGGWPLSVILDEERNPFFIGTYIPLHDNYGIDGMMTLLPKVAKRYKDDPAGVQREVTVVQKLIDTKAAAKPYQRENFNIDTLMQSYSKHYDSIYFGFSKHRKFPEASRIRLLFDLATLGKPEAKTMAVNTLRTMALHGLYDHIDGGFFRYSTDAAWEIPHFEKMLYNQAELIPLYAEAYRQTKEPLFRAVVDETIAMTLQRFGRDGLFFSASNADTDHEEGKYFLFTEKEVSNALKNNPYKKELDAAMAYDGFMNFEGKLHLNFYTQRRPEGFDVLQRSLQKVREGRRYPFIDTKIITAWNAMMIEALYSAKTVDKKYITVANEHLDQLLKLMYPKNRLFHQTLYGNRPKQEGLLEDYAFLISALIAGYEADYDKQKLALANRLTEQAIFLFYREGRWVQADDGLNIDVDLNDKYYTSSYGRMMQNLFKLAALSENFGLENIAKRSLEIKMSEIEAKQDLVPSSAIALLMQEYGVVILKHKKEKLNAKQKEIFSIRYPYLVTKVKEDANNFLACKVDRCFAYDKALTQVTEKIEGLVRTSQ